MAVITSNILLILITILFRNHKMMMNTGYKLLALFIALTTLRFVFPFELPFTVTVLLDRFKFLSGIIAFFQHGIMTLGTREISLWHIFEGVWLIGFIINLMHYILLHKKTRYLILANSLDVTKEEPYHSMLERICREQGKKNPFRVLTVSGLNTFMIYGIFHPCILIPKNWELSEDKWYYILSHEVSHHFHHDLLIKALTRFVTMIYWWNPAGCVLNKQADVILEMRADNVVAAYSKETIVHYLHCLTELGELATRQNAFPNAVTISLLTAEDSALIQRYHMLTSTGKKKNIFVNIILCTLFISIYAASHFIIFEAYYTSPEAAESIPQTENNTYAVLKENGTYDIYYLHYFIENVDSLEYYFSDIHIYTEKEFSSEEH